MAVTAAAFAATDGGVITKIDPNGDAITLKDGNTFALAEGTEAVSLKVGQTVAVTYKLNAANHMVATKIVVTGV